MEAIDFAEIAGKVIYLKEGEAVISVLTHRIGVAIRNLVPEVIFK